MKKLLVFLILLSTAAWSQDWAKQRLEKSPRHLEWVNVKAGNRTVRCFVAYPEVNTKAPAVIVIHEIFGLTDWVRSVADQLAEQGYVAIAPDLLSGMGPNGGGTESLGGDDAARAYVQKLPPEQVTADLGAVFNYLLKLPASNGQVSVAGFCWGGTQAFRYATHNPYLKGAYVFYGSAPEDVKGIKAPVFGFYAENDARINQTLPQTEEAMAQAKKTFLKMVYPGAGHGFMRAGEAPDASQVNKEAREKAWKRWLDLLGRTKSKL